MTRTDVAIAIVVRQKRILICQRNAEVHLGGFWEFPGGKMEPGETATQCLIRELREEVDIEVNVIAPLPPIEHNYADRNVRLHPFICEYRAGEATAIGCSELKWVAASELTNYRFPPANDSLITHVLQVFSPEETNLPG